jgi:hypothetical protein
MTKEKEELKTYFDSLYLKLSNITDRKAYIQHSIITRMDARRGRTMPLSKEEVETKLTFLSPEKVGEEHEFVRELIKENSREGVSAELALEVSDLTYYALQPNASQSTLGEISLLLEGILGIDMEYAYCFCILKYETRLSFGDRKGHAQIEKTIMERFLSSALDLQTLWEGATYT